MARRVFYSFHYELDSWRASQVRNIGSIEGNRPATDNDWETLKRGGDVAIKRWISGQMERRSCTVVLVGARTARRRWINHEIIESWNQHMGVVGIYVHGLKDANGNTSSMGRNPFDSLLFCDGSLGSLSCVVKCYHPTGRSSREKFDWISKHLADVVEEAIRIRNDY